MSEFKLKPEDLVTLKEMTGNNAMDQILGIPDDQIKSPEDLAHALDRHMTEKFGKVSMKDVSFLADRLARGFFHPDIPDTRNRDASIQRLYLAGQTDWEKAFLNGSKPDIAMTQKILSGNIKNITNPKVAQDLDFIVFRDRHTPNSGLTVQDFKDAVSNKNIPEEIRSKFKPENYLNEKQAQQEKHNFAPSTDENIKFALSNSPAGSRLSDSERLYLLKSMPDYPDNLRHMNSTISHEDKGQSLDKLVHKLPITVLAQENHPDLVAAIQKSLENTDPTQYGQTQTWNGTNTTAAAHNPLIDPLAFKNHTRIIFQGPENIPDRIWKGLAPVLTPQHWRSMSTDHAIKMLKFVDPKTQKDIVAMKTENATPDHLRAVYNNNSHILEPIVAEMLHEPHMQSFRYAASVMSNGSPGLITDTLMNTPGVKGILAAKPETQDKLSDQDLHDSLTHLYDQWNGGYGIIPILNDLKSARPGVHNSIANWLLDNGKLKDLSRIDWQPKTQEDVNRVLDASKADDLPSHIFNENGSPSGKLNKYIVDWVKNIPNRVPKDAQGKPDLTLMGKYYATAKEIGLPSSKMNDHIDPQSRYEIWKSLPEEGSGMANDFTQSKQGTSFWFKDMAPDTPASEVAKYAGRLSPTNYQNARAVFDAPGGPEFYRTKTLQSEDRKDKEDWAKMATGLTPEAVHAVFPKETHQALVEHAQSGHEGFKKILQVLKENEPSPISNAKKVNVKFTEKLRAARDLLEDRGGSAHYKELEKAGLPPKSLGLEHLRDPKTQHIKAEDVQSEIDKAPQEKFGVGHTRWTSDLQNHNPEVPNYVFQLKITPEIRKKLKDAGHLEAFQKMFDMSYKSGHPVDKDTLGWVRYSMGDDGTHIDEIQSDLGQSTERQLADMESQGHPEAAELLPHLRGINKIIWGDKHPSEVIHHAFLQTLRDSGLAGKPVHIWQAEPKAEISGQKQDEFSYWTDRVKEIAGGQSSDRFRPYDDGSDDRHEIVYNHLKGIGALADQPESQKKLDAFIEKNKEKPSADKIRYTDLASKWGVEGATDHAPDQIVFKTPLPVHMVEGYKNIPKKMGYKADEYGKLDVQGNSELHGEKTWSQKLRKSIDFSKLFGNNKEPVLSYRKMLQRTEEFIKVLEQNSDK